MPIEQIKKAVEALTDKYSIIKVVLFGSRADGTFRPDSDIDLIVEFSKPVSLLTLSMLRMELEEATHLDVDVIHGPVTEDDMIKVHHEVVLYAA